MISDWGEVVTRYPYGNVRMDHLLSKENMSFSILLVMFFSAMLLGLLLNIGNYIVEQTRKINSNNFLELAVKKNRLK